MSKIDIEAAAKKLSKKTQHDQEIEELKEQLRPKKIIPIPDSDFLSTGATLLNLGLTGDPYKGLFKGDFFYFVGDTQSGKSWISMNIFAEAALNKNFKDYRFIQDGGENGTLMDIEAFFGKAVKQRLEAPHYDKKKKPVMSRYIEELYFFLDDAFNDGRPFIYIKDSLDDLSDLASTDKFYEMKEAHEKGKDAAGSYGMAKPKFHANNINMMLHRLHDSGSIVIFISQTRTNIGPGSTYKPKTRSGGVSLTFMTQMEVWSSIREKLTKQVNGTDHHIGNLCKFKIQKTRITARQSEVEIPIYRSSGIDDLGSCITFLIDEKHWKKEKQEKEEKQGKPLKKMSEEKEKEKEEKSKVLVAPEFDFKGSEEDLIAKIEEENRENELRDLVGKVWKDIEVKLEVRRKRRYV